MSHADSLLSPTPTTFQTGHGHAALFHISLWNVDALRSPHSHALVKCVFLPQQMVTNRVVQSWNAQHAGTISALEK